ncbi:MAG: hypothetical protein LBP54_01890 [Campylobacteraceae bacterium]|nr:hypothetical protein [Campylobacteraceae bacterium]
MTAIKEFPPYDNDGRRLIFHNNLINKKPAVFMRLRLYLFLNLHCE